MFWDLPSDKFTSLWKMAITLVSFPIVYGDFPYYVSFAISHL